MSSLRQFALNLLPRRWRSTVRLWKLLASDIGHVKSVRCGRPVDANGDPIPWYTYPAIEYLRHLDFSACRVFEYGCGNSTLWWSSRVKQITSIEHDSGWAIHVRSECGGNAEVVVCSGNDYVSAINRGAETWNVIIIDGESRTDCASAAAGRLAHGGLVILDNSDWHSDACKILREQRLIQVDFHGFGPINGYPWTTSIFLHPEFAIAHLPEEALGPTRGIHPKEN